MANDNKIPNGDSKRDAELIALQGGSAVPEGAPLPDMPKEIVDGLVPAAASLLEASLKLTSTIKAPRVAHARWVLEQYFKMYTPNTSRGEVQIIDHADMAQIKQANKVMKEYNGYLGQMLNNRGGIGIGDN